MPKKQQRAEISGRQETGRRWVKRDARSGRFLSVKGGDVAPRVSPLDEIMALAARVVGSREAAERWLTARVPALDGARPKDLLRTSQGAARVREALHQIEHGIFA